jgi:hypothetical protein
MSYRSRLFLLTLALTAGIAQAQTHPKKWAQLRTPDGQPDLQGMWTDGTITPFERPARFADKPVLTEAEAAELEQQAAKNKANPTVREGDVGIELWIDSGTKVVTSRRTSLVVDPPDGRIALTPEAEAKHAYILAHNADSYEYMSLWDRCVTRGVPGGMFPGGHNNAYQIIQTPGYVVIAYEMIHEAHIVPLSGEHLPGRARQLNGDSIGHWEGDTLVVDTTNYNGHGQIATSAATGRLKGMPESEGLHVVERFTRVAADQIDYEVTIEDPAMYAKPWKVAIPLTGEPDYKMFEYACHEGNQAVELTLRGGRALEGARK